MIYSYKRNLVLMASTGLILFAVFQADLVGAKNPANEPGLSMERTFENPRSSLAYGAPGTAGTADPTGGAPGGTEASTGTCLNPEESESGCRAVDSKGNPTRSCCPAAEGWKLFFKTVFGFGSRTEQ